MIWRRGSVLRIVSYVYINAVQCFQLRLLKMDDAAHIVKMLNDATLAINSLISKSKKHFGRELSDWPAATNIDGDTAKKKNKNKIKRN